MAPTSFCAPALPRASPRRLTSGAAASRCSLTRRELAAGALSAAALTALPARARAAAARPTFVKDESGISYYDVKQGTGSYPNEGDFVTMDYVAFLSSGRVFDNRKNFVFQFGRRQVIPGLEAAVQSMRAGGQRKVVVPPALAYGAKGVCLPQEAECLVQPDETLGYDITLQRVALPPT